MNAQDFGQKLTYIQQTNAINLSVEERAALQSSLPILKRNGKFSRVVVWGKILALQKDYLIVQGFTENLLKPRKTFCSHDGIEWVQLPDVSEKEREKENDMGIDAIIKNVKGRFVGDLSFEYQVEVTVMVPSENEDKRSAHTKKSKVPDGASSEEETDTTDQQPEPRKEPEMKEKRIKKTITEEIRLSHTILSIDFDCSVVPRGALTRDHAQSVGPNITFEGLKGDQATQLRHYSHLRPPTLALKRSLLQREGLTASLDFLDTLEDDIPQGLWTLHEDKHIPQITIRSLLWPGYYFYHIPSSPNHGYFYFGFGEKNINLGFML